LGESDFVKRLLAWYRRERRDLPWRRNRDPYRVWIAETMLQQTTVKAVVPYFDRFVRRFPDIASLAAARESDVLALWSGLGYYARARNLHRAAKVLAEDHAGRLPDDPVVVSNLPGFGPYTTGAVLSIAFDRKVPLVDGNVARVLSRVRLVRGDPRSKEVRNRLWGVAGDLVRLADSASDFNQAMMELGALVCAPRRPACLLCPVSSDCAARRRGLEESLPERAPRARSRAVYGAAVVARRKRGEFLLARRSDDEKVMPGLYELPGVLFWEGKAAPKPEALESEIESRLGVTIDVRDEIGSVAHTITTRRLTTVVFAGTVEGAVPRGGRLRWATLRGTEKLPLSSLTKKILGKILDSAGTPAPARARR